MYKPVYLAVSALLLCSVASTSAAESVEASRPKGGTPAPSHATAVHHATTHTTVHHPPHAVHKANTTAHKAGTKAGVTGKKPSAVAVPESWVGVTEGFALAKKAHRPVVVDFFTDWCGWCKVMEAKTFHDPSVQKLLADNFVTVKANAEDGGAGQQLATKIGVNGYPTIGFFDANGNLTGQIVGFREADKFKTVLTDYLAGKPPHDE